MSVAYQSPFRGPPRRVLQHVSGEKLKAPRRVPITPKLHSKKSGTGISSRPSSLGKASSKKSYTRALDRHDSDGLDAELERIMATARAVLLSSIAGAKDREVAIGSCRDAFDAAACQHKGASTSADYFVTRARFEEFVGNHETASELFAEGAHNLAEPRKVLEAAFIKFLRRQAGSLLKIARSAEELGLAGSGSQGAAKTPPRRATAAAVARRAATGTPLSLCSGAVRVPSASSAGGSKTIGVNEPEPERAAEEFDDDDDDDEDEDEDDDDTSVVGGGSPDTMLGGSPPPCDVEARSSPFRGGARRVRAIADNCEPEPETEPETQTQTPAQVQARAELGVVAPSADSSFDEGTHNIASSSSPSPGAANQLPTALLEAVQQLQEKKRQAAAVAATAAASQPPAPGSVVEWSPVRLTASQARAAGTPTALTPVRRSARLTTTPTSSTAATGEQSAAEIRQLLEQTEFSFRPNPMLDLLRETR